MEKLVKIQEKLAKKIDLNYKLQKVEIVAGCDVAYKEEKAIACVVMFDISTFSVVDVVFHHEKVSFAYIAGFLAFREAPVIINAIAKLKRFPDVFIFDGHGIAHPEKMGLATHTGILIDQPSIGCAKSILTGNFSEPDMKRGSYSLITDEKEVIGAAVRTKNAVKPVFVSPGHKIDLQKSIEIILYCTTGKFRIPEPLRLAHILAGERKRRGSCCGKFFLYPFLSSTYHTLKQMKT